MGLQAAKISPAARVTDVTNVTDVCFCFVHRGPGTSEAAGGGALTGRSKTLAPEPLLRIAFLADPPVETFEELLEALLETKPRLRWSTS